ncbi:30S ribosomal protein S13 [Candidatus Microgenomates bacterium]|nr:30S ribosomal protein S13 [Candidatus Microgenomates bacterium]
MPRIAGIDLNNEKRIDIALTRLYGIGRWNVGKLLLAAEVDASKRVKNLTDDEVNRIQKAVDTVKVEGDLRAEVHGNITALKQIGAYRGIRHSRNLPSRGQRTKSNARTKRGKRVTIGAIKKELAEKMGIGAPAAPSTPPAGGGTKK